MVKHYVLVAWKWKRNRKRPGSHHPLFPTTKTWHHFPTNGLLRSVQDLNWSTTGCQLIAICFKKSSTNQNISHSSLEEGSCPPIIILMRKQTNIYIETGPHCVDKLGLTLIPIHLNSGINPSPILKPINWKQSYVTTFSFIPDGLKMT